MNEIKDLLEHVSQEVLLKILDSFSSATGLHAIIVDKNGRQQLPSRNVNNCLFCNIILNDPVGCNKCRGSYARATEQAAQFGEPYIFRCHGGLVAFAAPIVIEGNLIGSIICGQVLMWEPEDFFWEEIEEATATLNVDYNILISAVGDLEVISSQKVQAAANLLFVVANHIIQTGAVALQQKREIEHREKQLSSEIYYRKSLEKRLVRGSFITIEQQPYFHREKELLSQVRLGNKQDAQRILNEVLLEMMETYMSQPQFLKMKILELMAIIARSAVEGGANPGELANLQNQYLNHFFQIQKLNELCNLTIKVMNQCIDQLYGNIDSNYVGRAIKFIQENYGKNLNLTNIAQAVYISPCYLSHTFKAQTNCTIMEYVTKVRIEKAKKLLHNPEFTVFNVSQKLGYKDAGYFSKVFKKNEGITPKNYQKQLL